MNCGLMMSMMMPTVINIFLIKHVQQCNEFVIVSGDRADVNTMDEIGARAVKWQHVASVYGFQAGATSDAQSSPNLSVCRDNDRHLWNSSKVQVTRSLRVTIVTIRQANTYIAYSGRLSCSALITTPRRFLPRMHRPTCNFHLEL